MTTIMGRHKPYLNITGLSTLARQTVALAVVIAMCTLSLGCATTSKPDRNVDPLESINRPIYKFNTVVDKYILRPVAKGYDYVTPQPIRTGVSNFLDNFGYPVVILNSFLQGKGGQGVSDVGRFLVNSTVGIAGIFDPATHIGLEAHEEDFGQTFAKWGFAEGPYIMVPLLGPRTIRSGVGTLADIQVDPTIQLQDTSVRDKILIMWTIDSRANLLPVDEQINAAFDPYLFVRDAYLQNRQFLIKDGDDADNASTDDPFADELEEDF